jgi:uncharacterized protein involved in exopolysaccharide biosynthesis
MMADVKQNFAFRILDPPKVPDMHIKPKTLKSTLLSFFLSITVGIFAAFFVEYLETIKRQKTKKGQEKGTE